MSKNIINVDSLNKYHQGLKVTYLDPLEKKIDEFKSGDKFLNEVTRLDEKIDENVGAINSQLAEKTNKTDLPFVNIKDFGAKGDGDTDDTNSIQSAIDFVRQSNGGTVLIPPTDKFYKITNNIYIEGFDGSSSSSITIRGSDKTASKIKAEGDNITNIFEVINNGYNVNIKNLTLIGNKSTNGIKTTTSFAISSIKDIIMENVVGGLLINKGTWVSEYENILIRHCENGISFKGGCTSIFLKNTYIYNCKGIGYYLSGTYSTGVNLCADICGSPYIFNYADWYISSLGNEKSMCDNVLYFENSNVIIDNIRVSASNPSNAVIYQSLNGKIKIGNIAIADNTSTLKLYEFGYGPCYIEIGDLITVNSAGVLKDITYLENRQPCYYKEGGVLFKHSVTSNGKNVRTPLLTGNVSSTFNITWCDNKPHIIDGYDHQWLNSMPKGTLHLCTEFNNKGTIGFVRCDDNENAIYRNSTYLPIATIINGVTGNRPSQDLITGQCYFDKTLGKPVWYNGVNWVDSTGTVV